MKLPCLYAACGAGGAIADPPPFGSDDRLALWRSRSMGFRAAYRWNVLWALLCRDVGLRSAVMALQAPHAIVALVARPTQRGMRAVCPAWLAEAEQFEQGADR